MSLQDSLLTNSGAHPRPLLLGHRGTRHHRIPENTWAAFDKALRDGCDGFEFDVHLSADRRGIVCHDPTWHGLEIARSSFEELRVFRKLNFSRDAADVLQPPSLDGVLTRYANIAFLNIELKTPGLEETTIELLAALPFKRGVVVSSFLPEVLRILGGMNADVPLGFIFKKRAAMRPWEALPVSYLMPHHNLLSGPLLNEFHAAGKRVVAWTVNREHQMRFLDELGIDGLISDDTELLRRAFRRD